MSVSLATPIALALVALLALPVVAHLARQTPVSQQPFGAMLLLERLVKRLRRRRRVRDPLLLLLRLLALACLILAGMGPELRYPGIVPEYGGSGQVVILMDRSLSMGLQDGGSTLLQRARIEANGLLDQLPSSTLVAVVAFDDEAMRLTNTLTSDHDRARAQIAAMKGSHGRSNLRGALLEARRLLAGEPGEVFVLTDEAGPQMVTEATAELEALVEGGSSVIPVRIAADPARNVAPVSARYSDGPDGGQVVVRIANYGDRATEVACEVELPGAQVVPIFVDLPPNGEAEERITVPREVPAGVGRAWCEDPDLPLDDARYFHVPRVGASRVLIVDGQPGDTPVASEVYFLERALAPWGGRRSGVSLDVTTPVGLENLDPDRHRVVFLANVSDPRPYGLRLTEFVRRGGNIVISAGDNVTADRYNDALGSLLPARIRKVRSLADIGEPGVPLQVPVEGLALWEPFSRVGRRGFGRIRGRRVLTLEPYEDEEEVRITWLRYENGLPALVEQRTGQGRVLLWTGSLDLAWGNLPLQATFMPMAQRMVGWLGGEAGANADRMEARVGEMVAIELPDIASEPQVLGPDGQGVRSQVEGSRLLFRPDRPGAYQVGVADAPPQAWVAVNTWAEESDTRRGLDIATVEREMDPDLLTRRIEMGGFALALSLLLLCVQGALALRGVA